MTDTDSFGQTPSSLERYLVLNNSVAMYLSIYLRLSTDYHHSKPPGIRLTHGAAYLKIAHGPTACV